MGKTYQSKNMYMRDYLRFKNGLGINPKPTYEGFPEQVLEVTNERVSLPRPHYSDDRYRNVQLMYLAPDTNLTSVGWDYSDRFRRWDSDKTTKADKEASKHRFPSVQYFEAFIDVFYDGERVLKAVAGGVNHSNGYEYFVLGTVLKASNP